MKQYSVVLKMEYTKKVGITAASVSHNNPIFHNNDNRDINIIIIGKR